MTVHPRADLDFYVEPEWVTAALLSLPTFSLIGVVYDPCCGSGNVVAAARQRGFRGCGSDIEDRSRFVSFVADFRNLTNGAVGAQSSGDQVAVVSNPPYGGGDLAEAFIRHFVPMRAAAVVAVFVQGRFLYSRKRHALHTRDHIPSIVAHLSDRPSCPPGVGFLAGEIEAKGGSQDYCWLIYDKRGWDVSTRTVWLKKQPSKVENAIDEAAT
jgi:hypothetical protein